jgi:hypothetical protein
MISRAMRHSWKGLFAAAGLLLFTGLISSVAAANPASVQFIITESAQNAFPDGGGILTVTVKPASPGNGDLTLSGVPVFNAPGSLGLSLTVSGDVLTIATKSADPINVEQITITGLEVSASGGASPDDIAVTLGGSLRSDAQTVITTAAQVVTVTPAPKPSPKPGTSPIPTQVPPVPAITPTIAPSSSATPGSGLNQSTAPGTGIPGGLTVTPHPSPQAGNAPPISGPATAGILVLFALGILAVGAGIFAWSRLSR